MTNAAAGFLTAGIAIIGWLISHTVLITKALGKLPTIEAAAQRALTAVESGGVAPIVHKVEAELSTDARNFLDGAVARIGALAAPMAEPTDPTPADAPVVADPAPAAVPAPEPITAPAGAAEGAMFVVHGGQIVPQTA